VTMHTFGWRPLWTETKAVEAKTPHYRPAVLDEKVGRKLVARDGSIRKRATRSCTMPIPAEWIVFEL